MNIFFQKYKQITFIFLVVFISKSLGIEFWEMVLLLLHFMINDFFQQNFSVDRNNQYASATKHFRILQNF